MKGIDISRAYWEQHGLPMVKGQFPDLLPLIAAGLSEGESAMPWEIPDEEGCVGGSMAHEHTEGESAEEHGAHIEQMRLRDAQEEESARAALGEIDAQALRRAVIAAEVLGRPKALKRR